MRMWMLDPGKMCDRHLLGEHVEIHMLAGSIRKRRSLDGFLRERIIEPVSLKVRHDAIVKEMARRGFRHQSEIPSQPDISYLGEKSGTSVDRVASRRDLRSRCSRCRSLLEV